MGGVQLMLKLSHPGILHLEEAGLAGRHLLKTLQKQKASMLRQPTRDSEVKDKYQKLTSMVSCRSTLTNC